jgi:hypothetical protein
MAVFVFVLSVVGAVYPTVTVCPLLTAVARVNSTVLPLIATPLTVTGVPLTFTTKSLVPAVVAYNALS